MSDYINRDSIIKWIDDSLEQCGSRYTAEQENMMEMFRTVVNDCLPFADVVERKHGKWIFGTDEETGETDIYAWTCSLCRGKYPWQPNYCPNCGARMVSDDV